MPTVLITAVVSEQIPMRHQHALLNPSQGSQISQIDAINENVGLDNWAGARVRVTVLGTMRCCQYCPLHLASRTEPRSARMWRFRCKMYWLDSFTINLLTDSCRSRKVSRHETKMTRPETTTYETETKTETSTYETETTVFGLETETMSRDLTSLLMSPPLQ